jgi:hypothetical protein
MKMKLKITPEIERSMNETNARLASEMADEGFRAEQDELTSRYAVQEFLEKVISAPSYAHALSSFPTRRNITIRLSFGAGAPPVVEPRYSHSRRSHEHARAYAFA